MANIIIPPSPIATFTLDGVTATIEKMTVLVEPAQAGTGDPSTINVRTITGWSNIIVYQSGEDTSDPTINTFEFPSGTGTVYGGTFEVNADGSAKLTIDRWGVDLSTLTPNVRYTGETNKSLSVVLPKKNSYTKLSDLIAEKYKYINTASGAGSVASPDTKSVGVYPHLPNSWTEGDGSTNCYFVIGKDESLSGIMVFYIPEPIEVTFTAEQVSAVGGVNNFWANAGDIGLEYSTQKIKMKIMMNGVDMTDYFTPRGLKVSYVKVQGNNGGTFLSGEREEDILAWKSVVTLTCMPLTAMQQAEFLSKVMVADPTLYYFDPLTNGYKTIHYMASISETVHKGAGGTGTEYWTGLVLTAEEK